MNHSVYLILGSNIEPEKNTLQAIRFLSRVCNLVKMSSTWETIAVGSDGPNFLNTALLIETPLSAEEFKATVIANLENQLGRIRTTDKNAPRTIDLDIIIFDQTLLEPALWKKAFIAIPMAELLPEYPHPDGKGTLKAFIRQFEGQNLAFSYPLPGEKHS
jgi:2-amino-4-hydroxy-6-hydroxymethyldihydropteridine diphosphokinase